MSKARKKAFEASKEPLLMRHLKALHYDAYFNAAELRMVGGSWGRALAVLGEGAQVVWTNYNSLAYVGGQTGQGYNRRVATIEVDPTGPHYHGHNID